MTLDSDHKLALIVGGFLLSLAIIVGTVATIHISGEHTIESEAIKAGLHQEIINGIPVWTNGKVEDE